MTATEVQNSSKKLPEIMSLLAVIAIVLLAIGFCFSYGMHIGFGLNNSGSTSENEMMFVGFFAFFLILPNLVIMILEYVVDNFVWISLFNLSSG